MEQAQSFGFNFLHGTFSLKIEAIHILSKLQLLWFWTQQLSRKLRFNILSVQVCFVTIAFYFCVCPDLLKEVILSSCVLGLIISSRVKEQFFLFLTLQL